MFIHAGFEGLNISSELQMVLNAHPEYRKEMGMHFFPLLKETSEQPSLAALRLLVRKSG